MLMLNVIKFCNKTIKHFSKGIDKPNRELYHQSKDNEKENIISALQKNKQTKNILNSQEQNEI